MLVKKTWLYDKKKEESVNRLNLTRTKNAVDRIIDERNKRNRKKAIKTNWKCPLCLNNLNIDISKEYVIKVFCIGCKYKYKLDLNKSGDDK